jgi:hypothetical protein
MKNFAIAWGLTAAGTSLVFNTALYSPGLDLTGGFGVVNALLVGLFSLLPMGVTAGWAAYDAAHEGPRVHEGFWELYNNVVGDDKAVGDSARVRVVAQLTVLFASQKVCAVGVFLEEGTRKNWEARLSGWVATVLLTVAKGFNFHNNVSFLVI